jgi:proteasome assembly chaperone (PAC2) family protein
MDPVVATVIWGVVWLLLAGVFTYAGILVGIGFAYILEEVFQFDGTAIFGLAVGYIAGLIAAAWAVVQVVLHIIDLLAELGIING